MRQTLIMLLYETILDKYTTLELKGNSKCMDFKPFLEQTGCYLQQKKNISQGELEVTRMDI